MSGEPSGERKRPFIKIDHPDKSQAPRPDTRREFIFDGSFLKISAHSAILPIIQKPGHELFQVPPKKIDTPFLASYSVSIEDKDLAEEKNLRLSFDLGSQDVIIGQQRFMINKLGLSRVIPDEQDLFKSTLQKVSDFTFTLERLQKNPSVRRAIYSFLHAHGGKAFLTDEGEILIVFETQTRGDTKGSAVQLDGYTTDPNNNVTTRRTFPRGTGNDD